MSETGFRVFNIAYGLGADLAYAVLLTVFFHPFMAVQSRKWRKLPIVFSAYILCELICNRITLPRGSFGLILMITLLAASKIRAHTKSGLLSARNFARTMKSKSS